MSGVLSEIKDATLVVHEDQWHFELMPEPLSGSLSDLRIAPQVGRVPRVIEGPNGLRFETIDFTAVSTIEKKLNTSNILHRFEQSWKLAVSLSAVFLACLFFCILWSFRVLQRKLRRSFQTQ